MLFVDLPVFVLVLICEYMFSEFWVRYYLHVGTRFVSILITFSASSCEWFDCIYGTDAAVNLDPLWARGARGVFAYGQTTVYPELNST